MTCEGTHFMLDEHAAFIAAFQAEHREMGNLVQTLRRVFDDAQPWSREISNEGTEALAAMAKHLRHHFEQEEEGGYLEEALSAAPRFSQEAEVLLAQHSVMLRQADQALDLARSADDAAAWTKLKNEVKSLIASLIVHETAENKIVQQALNTGLDV